MDVRVKKIAVLVTILIMMNGLKSSTEQKNVLANNMSIGHKETAASKIDEIIIGSDYEGDSVAVMSGKHYVKKENITAKAYNENFINAFGFKVDTEKYLEVRSNISFEGAEEYSDLKGVTCFRGNNMRDSGSYGYADIKDEKLNIIWKKDIGSIDSWSGVGWNGQPAIVQWDKYVVKNMNIKEDKKAVEDLKEVIYATLDGNIYFLDLEDGKDTRNKLNIGAPIKGSLTVDPRGIPLLYAGQGIDSNGGKYIEFAYRIFSLTDFKKLYEIKGMDGFARRGWGAFDSTALIDKYKDYLFICGENGVVYSGKLNSKYENGEVSVNPYIDKYRYDAVNKYRKGIESSMAIYENYGFFADNDGLLQCLDLNTLTPVWVQDISDDTDSTVVLERDKKGLNLYTACEVDHQGNGGYSYLRKLDALSGRVLWENKYKCSYDTETNGGALATPIVGKNDISNVVIYNIARTPDFSSGILVALNKDTGEEVWKLQLPNYSWSSPIALYTTEGKGYIVQCDSVGRAMLIEGISGRILDTINLGANVEGTPAAFGNKIVVGTRGSRIVGFEVK
jgi:outer membrane protein assembly factor BamB